jgi:hypothetical protein
MISSGCGDLRFVKELHPNFFLLLLLRDECGLLDPFGDFLSTTNNARLTQGGVAAVANRRQGLKVEDEGLLKDLVIIFVFFGVLLLFDISFNASLIHKKFKEVFLTQLFIIYLAQEINTIRMICHYITMHAVLYNFSCMSLWVLSDSE